MLAAALEQWCERGDFTIEGLQVLELGSGAGYLGKWFISYVI